MSNKQRPFNGDHQGLTQISTTFSQLHMVTLLGDPCIVLGLHIPKWTSNSIRYHPTPVGRYFQIPIVNQKEPGFKELLEKF